jgi:hypothetical protein
MGYKINSTWTRLREKDINRLNEIIDDEYFNEKIIGRKLHILKIFEELLDNELARLRFDIIQKFMKENNWVWSMYENDKLHEAVPTIKQMIDFIKEDLFKNALFDLIELNKKEYTASSGGFILNAGTSSEYPSKDNCYLSIWFDISHLVND